MSSGDVDSKGIERGSDPEGPVFGFELSLFPVRAMALVQLRQLLSGLADRSVLINIHERSDGMLFAGTFVRYHDKEGRMMPTSFVLPMCAFFCLASNSIVIAQASDSVQVDWIRQYISGYNPNIGFANDIAVDTSGNVYVTGSSWGTNQLPDVVTIKYNSMGDTLWVRRYNGPGSNWDDAQALALDAAGNVYVTGRTYSDSTFFDYLTIKYDAAGVQQWIALYDGPSNNDDQAAALAVDGSGNLYVTGSSVRSSEARPDYATIKYNSAG